MFSGEVEAAGGAAEDVAEGVLVIGGVEGSIFLRYVHNVTKPIVMIPEIFVFFLYLRKCTRLL